MARSAPPPTSATSALATLASMDDIAADDDLLSDMLLDKLGFAPTISTHKMNPHYRSQRWNTEKLADLVRERIMIERDVPAAVEDLCKIPIIAEHLDKKSTRAKAAFQLHARRYLEAYLPDSGFEFAITNRYVRSINAIPNAASLYDASEFAESSAAGAARSPAPAHSPTPGPSGRANGKAKAKPRTSHGNHASAVGQEGLKKDLCVVALRAWQPGEIIPCKGGFKDLSKEQDEALRDSALLNRTGLAHEASFAAEGPRDFSIIKSTRRNCTQVLLGPARFVNHDCDPNAQFHKTGTHMTFKVIKPIRPNEEILVLYGEHYFGVGNSECLCATCEKRGKGVYATTPARAVSLGAEATEARKELAPVAMIRTYDSSGGNGSEGEETDVAIPVHTSSSSSDGEGRRPLSKRIKTASRRASPGSNGDTRASQEPLPSRNDSALLKALTSYTGEDRSQYPASPALTGDRADHFPSDREMLDPEGMGKLTRCATCVAPFLVAEWYKKDECVRCERHFTIYQADYPHRSPTEAKWVKVLEKHQAKVAQADDRHANDHIVHNGGSKVNKRKLIDPASDDDEVAVPVLDTAAAKKKGKGKGKEPSVSADLKANAKGRASSSVRQKKALPALLARGARGGAAGSPSLDPSRASESSSPVQLTPLRPKESSEGEGVNGGARHSHKAVAKMDTDEDWIEQELSATKQDLAALNLEQANRALQDSDSDLSDPPPNTSDAETSSIGSTRGKLRSVAMSAAGSMESALSTGSSADSSESRPCGPKMLGKDANVGALATHWGAQGEDKRMRKPSVNGPVSLAKTIPPPRKPSGHRRTASASSSRLKLEEPVAKSSPPIPASSLPGQSSRGSQSGDGSPFKRSSVSLAPSSRRGSRDVQSEDSVDIVSKSKKSSARNSALADAATTNNHVHRSAETTPPVQHAAPSPRQASATSNGHVIATHGVERTSERNLSLAWSAGLEGGRTRRQATRDPSTVASTSTQRGGTPRGSAPPQGRSSPRGQGPPGGGSGSARSTSAREKKAIKEENSSGFTTPQSDDPDVHLGAPSPKSTFSRAASNSVDMPHHHAAQTASAPEASSSLRSQIALAQFAVGSDLKPNHSGIGTQLVAEHAAPGYAFSSAAPIAHSPDVRPSSASYLNGLAPSPGQVETTLGSSSSPAPSSGSDRYHHPRGRRNLRVARPGSTSRPLACVTGSATNAPIVPTSGNDWPGVQASTSTSNVATPAAAQLGAAFSNGRNSGPATGQISLQPEHVSAPPVASTVSSLPASSEPAIKADCSSSSSRPSMVKQESNTVAADASALTPSASEAGTSANLPSTGLKLEQPEEGGSGSGTNGHANGTAAGPSTRRPTPPGSPGPAS